MCSPDPWMGAGELGRLGPCGPEHEAHPTGGAYRMSTLRVGVQAWCVFVVQADYWGTLHLQEPCRWTVQSGLLQHWGVGGLSPQPHPMSDQVRALACA